MSSKFVEKVKHNGMLIGTIYENQYGYGFEPLFGAVGHDMIETLDEARKDVIDMYGDIVADLHSDLAIARRNVTELELQIRLHLR